MSTVMCRTEMLCILYCDIVSSTAMGVEARQEGAEATYNETIRRFVALWREALEAAGAAFVKPMGDGVLATFRDPRNAVMAAVTARESLDADPLCRGIRMRVGLHIGSVSVQSDGDILGPDAALGERIMAQAQAGHILVSEACATQVRLCLPADYRLHDLGESALKGFDRPTRIYQLCAPGFGERAQPFARTSRPKGNLPVALDSFVGRRRERAQLRRFLADPVQRCVTLVGAGGSGKTRLALQVAQDVQDPFPDGTYFVALEECTDTDGVYARIAAALGTPLRPNAEAFTTLESALTARRMLLILDNFEQALSAAGGVAALLEALPGLRVLVTSREPLRFRGERVYDLDPLGVPPPSASYREITASESVRLFKERLQAADRQFRLTEEKAATIADICRALSGLPLAVEIVAAEARYRPLSALRQELQSELLDLEARMVNIPARQRTLRAAFEVSYRQLSEADRALFAQLSLFETAFGSTEVYDVCTGADLEDGLRRLQDKSLVCFDGVDHARPYRLLVPVREYARDRLGVPQGAVRQRFIAAFTRRAQNLRDAYYKNAEPEALSGVQMDLDNFRAAWNLASEDDQPESIADLGMAVTFFVPFLPRATNIEVWLEDTERALRRLEDRYRLGKLYNARARLANIRGAFVDAVAYQRKVLDCLTETGSDAEIADVHSTLAWQALRAQDFPTAERHARRGLELGRKAGETEPQAVAFCVLASVLTPQNPEEAARMAQRSLALFREQGERVGMAHASIALAAIAEAHEDLAAAEARYRDALGFCWELGMEVQVARCLEMIAKFYARSGDRPLASTLLAAAANAQKALGLPETARLALPETDLRAEEEPPLAAVVEGMLSAPPAFHR
jgi:predicted ATPase/class 3 adenylate cyclase